MSRYIDADHLRKWILSWWERTEPTSEYLKGGDILNQIDREPSIDIVRCKECEHRDAENGFCEGRGWPMQLVPDDGFCDKGGRSRR